MPGVHGDPVVLSLGTHRKGVHVFAALPRGLALLEGFEFLRIETHVAEESDEREASGCKVEVIDKPGELRFAKYHAPTRQHNLGQPWDSGSNFLNKFDRL